MSKRGSFVFVRVERWVLGFYSKYELQKSAWIPASPENLGVLQYPLATAWRVKNREPVLSYLFISVYCP